MNRVLVLALAAGLSASVVSLASAQIANACTLIPGNYYAVAQWQFATLNQQGASFNTTVSPIGVSGAPNGSHVNQTLWMGTDSSTDLSYWVELGYIKGFACDTTLSFYYAWDDPTHGFQKFLIPTSVFPAPVVGEGYTFEIVNVLPYTWNIVLDGTLVAQSLDNPSGSYSMMAGAESSNTANYLPDGNAQSLEHKVNGTWTTYWGSGTILSQAAYPCTIATWANGAKYLDLNDSIGSCGG